MRLHRAEERARIAQTMIDLTLTVCRGRFGMRRGSLTGELELILIAAAVLIADVKNSKQKTAADVGRTMGIPRVTARRKLQELVRRGILERQGNCYTTRDDHNNNFKYVDSSLKIIQRAADKRSK